MNSHSVPVSSVTHQSLDLLDRLEKVRSTGPGRWLARCPAHADKSPSLAIRQTGDGRILLHCFTGCDVTEVIRALGLDMADLFTPTTPGAPSPQRPFPALDVLRAVAHEITIAAIACADIVQGRPLSAADLQRVQQAQERLQRAVRIAEGKL
ncbi:MAG: DNA primase [Candidatus Competibacteraceae bacterium]|nr:DNA primase [Candidatus Competibacteraceae bacterium]MCB1811945.1 DNA primase [Candidatus Competibacteraceae bacterium]